MFSNFTHLTTRPLLMSSAGMIRLAGMVVAGCWLLVAGSNEQPATSNQQLSYLSRDRRIGNLVVGGEQKRLAQNHRQRLIALEGQEQARVLAARRDDAQILVVRLHQDVAASQMDFICAKLAAH